MEQSPSELPRFELYPYGNKNNPPLYLPSAPETPIRPELFPAITEVDTSLNTDKILAASEIPEIVPVMLGLRQAITEARVDFAQRKLEKLAKEHKVARAVGKAIIQGKGYMDESFPDRPTTRSERIIANRLERTTLKRRLKQVKASHLHNAVGHSDRPITRLGEDLRDPTTSQPVRRSSAETRSISSNQRTFKSLSSGIGWGGFGSIKSLDKHFTWIMDTPAEDAKKHIVKRDGLIVKREAIVRARHNKAARRRS